MRTFFPVLTVVAAIVALWYVACVPMNIHTALTDAERAGVAVSVEGAAARLPVFGCAHSLGAKLLLLLSSPDFGRWGWAPKASRVASVKDGSVNERV